MCTDCCCLCSSFNLNFLDFVMVAYCCAATIFVLLSSRQLYGLLCCWCFFLFLPVRYLRAIRSELLRIVPSAVIGLLFSHICIYISHLPHPILIRCSRRLYFENAYISLLVGVGVAAAAQLLYSLIHTFASEYITRSNNRRIHGAMDDRNKGVRAEQSV